jgi:hypothetical protein
MNKPKANAKEATVKKYARSIKLDEYAYWKGWNMVKSSGGKKL